MTIEYGRAKYRISTQHGENGSVHTIVKLHGPTDAGWTPLASVRSGEWIGPLKRRYRIVGPRGNDSFVADGPCGMDEVIMAGTVLNLLGHTA